MRQGPVVEGNATALGRVLGLVLRIAVAVALLGGLLGAALGAARSSSPGELSLDLSAGRVVEIEFTDSAAYRPGLDRDGGEPVVRWRVTGAGWRTMRLDDGPLTLWPDGPDPAPGSPGPPGAEAPVGADSGTDPEQAIRARAEAAGVPVVERGPDAAHRLAWISTIVSMLLVPVLIGGPQPRRATKWAWFWLMLVPGGITQLAWVAREAPWSSRANRLPEPRPHRDQPDDTRLTGGWAFLLCLPLGLALTLLGHAAATWLSG